MRLLPTALAATLLTVAANAQAHPGHGATSLSHWHASDAVGFAVLAAIAAVALWMSSED